jgi:hypothetical protein
MNTSLKSVKQIYITFFSGRWNLTFIKHNNSISVCRLSKFYPTSYLKQPIAILSPVERFNENRAS